MLNRFLTTSILALCLLTNFWALSQSFVNLPSLQGHLKFVEINESSGVSLTGGMELFKSTDDGLTWSELDDTFGNLLYWFEINDATILSSSTYCLIGYNVVSHYSAILRTNNGGLTWTEYIPTSTSPNLEYLAIESVQNNVVVTAVDGVYTSVDGGLSWTYSPLSSNGYLSSYLTVNTNSSEWLTGGYGVDFNYDSTLYGTWTNLAIPNIDPSQVFDITNNNEVLMTSQDGMNTTFSTLGAGFNVNNSTSILNDYFYAHFGALKSFKLPNNTIITFNPYKLHNVNPQNGYVLHYTDHLINTANAEVDPNDMDMGQTYGLVVGNSGTIMRFDLSQAPSLEVPADFTIHSGTDCAQNPLVAEADFPFADSIQWFYNGVYISSDSILNYVNPAQSGTNVLEMRAFVDGDFTSEQESFTFSELYIPPPMNISMDTIICFGSPVEIDFFLIPTIMNTYYSIYTTQQTLQVSQPLQSGNYTISLPTLTVSDSLFVEILSHNNCDTVIQTYGFNVIAEPNLTNFTVLPSDSVLCTGDSMTYFLANTVDDAYYFINGTSSFGSGTYNSGYSVQGNNSDTIQISAPSSHFMLGFHPETYGGASMYYSFTITSANGCESTGIFSDTVKNYRYDVNFVNDATSYYSGDTIGFVNPLPRDTIFWDIADFPSGDLQNVNDSIPFASTDTTGLFEIELVGHGYPNCIDTMRRTVCFGDYVNNDTSSICAINQMSTNYYLVEREYDENGNLYISGAKESGNMHVYTLSKYDPDGNELWVYEAPASFSEFGYVVISGIDFSSDGSVYCVLSANITNSYYGSNYALANTMGKSVFLTKINPQTGFRIWSKNINEEVGYTLFTSISDIAISNDTIILSAGSKVLLSCFDLDGNRLPNYSHGITHSEMGGSIVENHQFITYLSGGMYRSPKLEVLSTGEVVGLVYYKTNPPPTLYTNLNPNSELAYMVFKYTPTQGIYDVTLLGENGDGNLTGGQVEFSTPTMLVTKEDDIIFAMEMTGGINSIRDSVLDINEGIVVCKTDSDFNLKWITAGNGNGVLNDINIAKETGEVFITLDIKTSYYLKNDSSFYNFGGIGELYPIDTNGYNWSVKDSISLGKLMVITLDNNGVPTDQFFYQYFEGGNTNNESSYISVFKIAPTPCGDYSLLFNSDFPYPDSVLIDSIFYPLSNGLIVNFRSDCAANSCQFLQFPDTVTSCANNSVINIPIIDQFNIDSISYSIYDNNNYLLYSGVSATLNNSVPITNPFSSLNEFMVVFSSPTLDSVLVQFVLPPAVNYTYDDTICNNQNIVIQCSPPSYTYVWGNGDTTDLLSLNHYDYNIGANILDVEATNSFGCTSNETLSVYVHDAIEPTIMPAYYVHCNDTLIIEYNDSSFISNIWSNGPGVISNLFHQGNLSIGNNTIYLYTIDTNGCQLQTTTILQYCTIGIDELSGVANDLNVVPNPSNGIISISMGEQKDDKYTIIVLDSQGRIVYEQNRKLGENETIDLNIASGLYYISIFNEEVSYSQKIVIE